MLTVLILIFSGYGLYNLALELDIKFLDKLEAVIDYRVICRVLEYMWATVGIAIHIYANQKNILISDIMNINNKFISKKFRIKFINPILFCLCTFDFKF